MNATPPLKVHAFSGHELTLKRTREGSVEADWLLLQKFRDN